MAHAIFSPSSAHRRVLCRGSMALEFGAPDTRNAYSDEGTAAHFVGAELLRGNVRAEDVLGRTVGVLESGEAVWGHVPGAQLFEVTHEMYEAVGRYVEAVHAYQQTCGDDADLFIEAQVPIGHITGETDGSGSVDAGVFSMSGDELQVHDLKYGRGVVVEAEGNEQMALYAMGLIKALEGIASPKRVRLVIHQPRICPTPSEWVLSVGELQVLAIQLGEVARTAFALLTALQETGELPEHRLSPGDEQCRFCKAKGKCPALAKAVRSTLQTAAAEFPDLAPVTGAFVAGDAGLGAAMDAVPLIELWTAAIRGAVERELLTGGSVPGYKLVQGRKGPRAWDDEKAVQELVKGMRTRRELFFEEKFKTAPALEKLMEDKLISESQWERIAQHIVQKEGSPSVAPVSDKRPAISVSPDASEFDVI